MELVMIRNLLLLISAYTYLLSTTITVAQTLNPLFHTSITHKHTPPHHIPLTLPAQQFLHAHNRVRALHGEPPLLWNGLLERFARNHARILAPDCTPGNSKLPHDRFGVNVFMARFPGMWPPARIVSYWASDRRFFNPKSLKCLDGFQDACGDYTHLVWWRTHRIGCGQARCARNRGMITVCAYDPAGNYRKQNPFARWP